MAETDEIVIWGCTRQLSTNDRAPPLAEHDAIDDHSLRMSFCYSSP